MRKLILGTVLALVGFTLPLGLIGTQAARADTNAVDFETPTYASAPSNPNGQDGWVFTGPYDAVIDSSFGTPGFGMQSLRMSNATTSGSFADWVFSKPLTDEAGESGTNAVSGGFSGGTRQNAFEAKFDIASKTGTTQPGLQISVSPDRGDGARMSFLRFKDNGSGGTDVLFDDYQDLAPFGTTGTLSDGCDVNDDFVETNVATISDSAPHTIKLNMVFADGQRNDTVEVYVDGSLVHTGTSWEDYYRYCEATNDSRTVDSLILQARTGGGTAPATAGNGFLIDNMNLTSSMVPTTAPTLSIGSATPVTEGNTGTTNASVPVSISSAYVLPVDVHWATSPGTATSPADYVSSFGDLHWNAGDSSPKTILVPVKGDTLDEFNETFTVTLSSPSNATISGSPSSTVTINDDDNAPKVSIFGVSQVEGDGPGTTFMNFNVAIPKKSGKDITVHYQTSKGSALPGQDYFQRHGDVTIPAGKMHKLVKVRIIGDTTLEANENFSVGISAPVNTVIQDGSATGVILNDD